jgi:hypothetical protein
MRRLVSISFVVLALAILSPSAKASMFRTTRDWSVIGPGGHYGFIESEFSALSGEHVAWETSVACGPLHFNLPCRAPFSVTLFAGASAFGGWLAFVLFSRIRNYGLRTDNVA